MVGAPQLSQAARSINPIEKTACWRLGWHGWGLYPCGYYYGGYPYYGYYGYGHYPPAPAYYPAAPYNPPARCWSPYYHNYYAC